MELVHNYDFPVPTRGAWTTLIIICFLDQYEAETELDGKNLRQMYTYYVTQSAVSKMSKNPVACTILLGFI